MSRGRRRVNGRGGGQNTGSGNFFTKKLFEYAESEVSDISDLSSATLAKIDLSKETSLTKVCAYH